MSQSTAGVVLDASVSLKLVLSEEFSEHARALVEAALNERRPLFGPPLLFAEVTNALHQRVRRRDLTETEAETALEQFLRLPIRQIHPERLYQQALAFARTHRIRSIYDSLYVVLAQMLGTELWTADRTLLNTLGQAAPWVRWIGDYPLPTHEGGQP